MNQNFKIIDYFEEKARTAIIGSSASSDVSFRSKVYVSTIGLLDEVPDKFPEFDLEGGRRELSKRLEAFEIEFAEQNGLAPVSDHAAPQAQTQDQSVPSKSFSKLKVMMAAAASGIVLLLVAGYFLFTSQITNTPDSASKTSQPKETVSEVKETTSDNDAEKQSSDSKKAEPSIKLPGATLTLSLPSDLNQFDPIRQDESENYALSEKDGLTAKGRLQLLAKQEFTVDDDSVYLMSAVIKVHNRSIAEAKGIVAGFATYNEERKLETEAPGTHRYFVINYSIPESHIDIGDGWLKISNTISGREANANSFRPTTKFARPFIMTNFNEPDQIVSIKEISVVQIQ